MSSTASQVIRVADGPEPLGPYPHARRVGGLVFVSGIGPRTPGSKDIPGVVRRSDGSVADYSIEAQIRSAFASVRTILESAGSGWERIVDVQCFLTDLRRDWAEYNRVYAEYFPPGPHQPTRTTVEVSRLPQGGNAPINFEVKVIASAEGGSSAEGATR